MKARTGLDAIRSMDFAILLGDAIEKMKRFVVGTDSATSKRSGARSMSGAVRSAGYAFLVGGSLLSRSGRDHFGCHGFNGKGQPGGTRRIENRHSDGLGQKRNLGELLAPGSRR